MKSWIRLLVAEEEEVVVAMTWICDHTFIIPLKTAELINQELDNIADGRGR